MYSSRDFIPLIIIVKFTLKVIFLQEKKHFYYNCDAGDLPGPGHGPEASPGVSSPPDIREICRGSGRTVSSCLPSEPLRWL
jgi:hypothetical protein